MLKNIIFDLDNTIILDTDEDALCYKDALKKLGYDENDYWNIYNEIEHYERERTEENYFYSREEILKFLNNQLNRSYDIALIDALDEQIATNWTKHVLIKEEVLQYLSSKYNLYVYSNYFQKTQEQRLETIGYLKYFKQVFGADIYGCKPFKKAFEGILKEIDALPEECVMIGDTKGKEILVASLFGMKGILYDYDGKRDKPEIQLNNYIVIKDMNQLKTIL